MLIFPGQHLEQEAQLNFARRFGRMDNMGGGREAIQIGNKRHDGSTVQETDPVWLTLNYPTQHWHQDGTFNQVAAKCGICFRTFLAIIWGLQFATREEIEHAPDHKFGPEVEPQRRKQGFRLRAPPTRSYAPGLCSEESRNGTRARSTVLRGNSPFNKRECCPINKGQGPSSAPQFGPQLGPHIGLERVVPPTPLYCGPNYGLDRFRPLELVLARVPATRLSAGSES